MIGSLSVARGIASKKASRTNN